MTIRFTQFNSRRIKSYAFIAALFCAGIASAVPVTKSPEKSKAKSGSLLTEPGFVAPKLTPRKLPMNTPLPLFYRELTAFDTDQHGKLSFPDVPTSYRFAAQTNVIPLLINEIPFALQHYPLVFLPGNGQEPPTLAALVGIGDDKNRYVNADGQWRADTYIPAWVRRYPFLAVGTDTQADPVLAIDTKAEWLDAKGGDPFIGADGKPTARLEFVLNFQREFADFAKRTQTIVRSLYEAGVLEGGSLRIDPPAGDKAGQSREIQGFFIVSEPKLRSLSAKQAGKLHQSDALGLAYAQLFSMANLAKVLAEPVAPVTSGTPAIPAAAPAKTLQ